MKIQLTQQIIVSNKSNKFAQLDELCFLSKNLYNVALYHIRQYYKETGKYLSYNKLAKTLSDTNNLDYRAIPYAQSAQQVLRQVDSQYKAFYASIKSKKMKGKKVRLPKYKDKEKEETSLYIQIKVLKFLMGLSILRLSKVFYRSTHSLIAYSKFV